MTASIEATFLSPRTGYFGEDALAERDRLIVEAAQATDAAAVHRDTEIEAARTSYDQQRSSVERGLDDALAALQTLHDPFPSEVAATSRPTEAPEPTLQERTPVAEAAPEPYPAPAPAVEVPAPEAAASTPAPAAVEAEPVEPESLAIEAAAGSGTQEMWVTAEHLAIRSCPSTDCGQMSGTLSGSRQTIYEERDGWGRVSEPYEAACDAQGLSDMIDTGNRRCEPENGIIDGQVAQWLSLRYMTDKRPADPAEGTSGIEQLVANSDNFSFHREAFITAAQTLLDEGRCTEAEFREMGGFFQAPSQGSNGYAIFCGGTRVSNRIYLNVETGEIYR